MSLTRKEIIAKIKELLSFSIEQPKVEEPAKVEETPAVEDQKETPAPEQVQLTDEKPAVEETPAPIEVKFASVDDVEAMKAEIIDLRAQVAVMSEYAQLKDQYNYLKNCISQMQAAFSQTVELVSNIADESTDKPAQEPKDQPKNKKKNLEKYFQN